ncbi:60S acidic ribosomal protein P2-like [Prionailurus iriomotensis]
MEPAAGAADPGEARIATAPPAVTLANLPIPWAMMSSMLFPVNSQMTLSSRSSSASMPMLSRIFLMSLALGGGIALEDVSR